MSDAIEIKGLRVMATHGVLDEEKDRAQPFEIDLVVEADLAPAAKSDDLADALDYSLIADGVVEVALCAHYELLETLADNVAAKILGDRRVNAVTVTIRKLRPPLRHDVATVGVSITRTRKDQAR